jgi:hypothetical protein
MSHDRVEFKIDLATMNNATRKAFAKAFGHPMKMIPKTYVWPKASVVNQVTTIVCRPSQFARFLIYRNELGGQNMFKELEPRLFVPEPAKPQPLDVSLNPAATNPFDEECD